MLEKFIKFIEIGPLYERLTSKPIPQMPQKLAESFDKKEWKKIPIKEKITSEPKHLEVIPNTEREGEAMAWPAYYKFTKTILENKSSGFGELAKMLQGDLQVSPFVKLRPEIKNRLDKAQKKLDNDPTTNHLKLVVVDGYRTLQVQKRLFESYLDLLRKEKNGALSEQELLNEAQKMVSIVPKNEILKVSPPPHSTGGSVDIILVDKSKIDIENDYWLDEAMVNFGADFDEMMHPTHGGERSETAFYENKEDISEEEKEARSNRRLLFHLMKSIGLSNYPHEYWHFDFGNQFNALVEGKNSAEYGFAGGLDNGMVIEDKTVEIAAYIAHFIKNGISPAKHFGL